MKHQCNIFYILERRSSMTEANVFKFELNEFLSFQKGQEVLELIGIALEPDISIYESKDNVTIRGVIELTGEYIPDASSSEDDGEESTSTIFSFQNQSMKNYIQDVRRFEDGLNEFRYHIPVEVTIPKYRVPSLDDVMVEIDYFDYEIPDASQLKVQAEVLITGIEQETFSAPEAPPEPTFDEEEITRPFSFDVKFDEDEEVESSSFKEEEKAESFSFRDESPAEKFMEQELMEEEVNMANEEESREEEKEEEKPDRFWFKQEKTQSLEEFFAKPKEDDIHMEESSSSSSSSVSPEAYGEEVVEDYYDDYDFPEHREEEELVETSKEPGYTIDSNKKEDREEVEQDDTFYLVNMFKEDEYAFSRIKMCIVQESDTVDSIAERYDLPRLQLMRYNNLEEDDLKPGDILYIPRKLNKNPS